MNCKPGDIAINVRGPENLGALFEILDDFMAPIGEWRARSLSHTMTNRGRLPPGQVGYVVDRVLRPLRGLGDAAPDEMLHRIQEPAAA